MGHLDQFELFDASLLGHRPARRSPRLPHRLYFALRPPTRMATTIHDFARLLSAHRRRLPQAGNLHVSTNGIGEFDRIPDDILSRANAAGGAVRGAAFEVVFDRVQTFGSARQRPIVLRCAEGAADIAALRALIAAALRQQGLPSRYEPATPHLTLWYDEIVMPEQVLPRPFRWLVQDFFLIHGTDALPHKLPGRWRLGD